MPKHIISGQEQLFDYQGLACSFQELRISLLGRHQVDNAACAIAAVECLRSAGVAIDDAALRRGLADAHWDGRMERVAHAPDIYLDGAHNPASAKRLAETVRQIRSAYQRLILVIGVLSDKDYQSMLEELVPCADQVVVTKPNYSRAMDAVLLGAAVSRLHASVIVTETIAEALDQARKIATPADLILVAGSLYVVGDARARLLPAGSGSRQSSALSNLKG
jgi:dihydrofolate synthase/folylpolyglutamate synthase